MRRTLTPGPHCTMPAGEGGGSEGGREGGREEGREEGREGV